MANSSLTQFFGSTMSTLGSYVYNTENRGKMLAIHTLSCVDVGIQIIIPLLCAKWLAKTHFTQSLSVSAKPLIVALSCLVLGLVILRVRNLLVDSVKRNVQQEITLDMVKKIYDDQLDEVMGQPTGKAAAIVSKNYGSVEKVMPIFVSDILPALMETCGISAILCSKFGMVGMVPLLVMVPYFVGAIAGEILSLLLKINNQSTMVSGFGKLLEVINNYTIAHQYGNRDLELHKLDTSLNTLGKSFRGVHRAEEATASVLALITKAGMIGALAYVYYKPPTAGFWPIGFILFGYYILRATTLAESLPSKINALFTGLADTHLIVDFFKKGTPVPDPKVPQRLDLKQAPCIEFRNVSFTYGEGKKGIQDINFVAEPGQKIAIMGATGSGKSTLLKLFQRFYDYKGQILINGVDSKDLKKDELRSYLSVVSQDTKLMNDTLINNIKYGDRTATDEDIFAAASFVKLELPRDRFFESVQQDGTNFSGGEKQRANIARALLKRNSYIFLLDEPTSSLDQRTAKDVHDILDQLTADVTTLMVTHDPHAVMHVDLIVYMEDGTIVEKGTFSELMNSKGAFYKQFLIQCEKLGINVSDINPVACDRGEKAQSFCSWREKRRKANA